MTVQGAALPAPGQPHRAFFLHPAEERPKGVLEDLEIADTVQKMFRQAADLAKKSVGELPEGNLPDEFDVVGIAPHLRFREERFHSPLLRHGRKPAGGAHRRNSPNGQCQIQR